MPNRRRQGLRSLPAALCLSALCALPVGGAFASTGRGGEDAAFIRPSAPQNGLSGLVRTLDRDGRYQMTARFRSFSGDPLSISFPLERAAAEQSMREFGTSSAELDALVKACMNKRGCNQAELDKHTTRYYREHGMRLATAGGKATRLYVDVPQVAHRNRTRVEPVAAALRKLAAQQGRDMEWTIDAAVALVQTGLPYRQPDTFENGRRIAGFYPPPRALEQGYGDCDTKAALLASILLNLTQTKIVGVHVPQHYLLGIAGKPQGDQASIEFRGQTYVLIEVAGPAMRRRGEIADQTRAALDEGGRLRVDPIL